MNLKQFDKRLRELVPPNSRPFLCEGSPLECDIFIVGNNPGTNTPFWEYWELPYGCRKSEWLKDFRERHQNEKKRVRDNMETMIRELSDLRYLETNAYAPWSKWASDLKGSQTSTEIYEFLLKTIKPKLIFAHGAKSRDFILDNSDRAVELNSDAPTAVKLLGFETNVYVASRSLMYWSANRCHDVGMLLHNFYLRQLSGRTQPKTPNVTISTNKPSMVLTKAAFADFLVENEGRDFEAKDGTPFTFQLSDPSPHYASYFPYSMRVLPDTFGSSSKRAPGPKQLAYFLKVFNLNPHAPLADYRNKDGAGSKAYNAKFVVPLMSKATSSQA